MGRMMLRSLFAILCGWAAICGGSIVTMTVVAAFNAVSFRPGSEFSTGWLLVNLLVTCFWSVIGGYVTGLVARRREIRHTIGLIVLTVIVSAFLSFLNRREDTAPQVPSWYMIAWHVSSIPSVLLGGWLRMRRRMSADPGRSPSNLWLSIAATVKPSRLPVAIIASAGTFLGSFYVGLLLSGLGLAGSRALLGRSCDDVVFASGLIASSFLAAMLARHVFRKIIPVDVSLLKDAI